MISSMITMPGIIQRTLFSTPSCTPRPTISIVTTVTSVAQPPSAQGLALPASKMAPSSATLCPDSAPLAIFHR